MLEQPVVCLSSWRARTSQYHFMPSSQQRTRFLPRCLRAHKRTKAEAVLFLEALGLKWAQHFRSFQSVKVQNRFGLWLVWERVNTGFWVPGDEVFWGHFWRPVGDYPYHPTVSPRAGVVELTIHTHPFSFRF